MILKKLKRTNFRKTKAAMIGGLVDYILAKQDEDGNKKSAYAYGFNFVTSTTKGWKWEMTSLAEESVQSKMPVAHWVMSWPEDEHPSKEQVIEATNIFLERMGLSGHQAIIAAHQNTDNFHVHIVVNRTHPVTLKVIQPHRGFDINAAHRIVAEISEKQGWKQNTLARYTVEENGYIVPNTRDHARVRPSNEAAKLEAVTGEKSAQRIAQERGRGIIQQAETWKELHEKLVGVGLRFAKKGSGAVIFVGDTAVKASSVDRKFGLSTLCKRLGEYEDGDYPQDRPRRAPEPLQPDCVQEWNEYQELQQENTIARHKTREQKKAAQEALKQEQRQERKRVLTAIAEHGVSLLNIARHLLKEKQRQIDTPPRLAASLTASTVPALPPFRTWLRKRDREQANMWRYSHLFAEPSTVASPLEAYNASGEVTCTAEQKPQSFFSRLKAFYTRHTKNGVQERTDNTSVHDGSSDKIMHTSTGVAQSKDTYSYNINEHDENIDYGKLKLRQKVHRIKEAFKKHLQDVKNNSDIGTEMEPIEAQIAMRMMYNGYAKKDVYWALYTFAPAHCDLPRWNKDWYEYATFIVGHAFSARGESFIRKNRELLAHWRELEGMAPDKELPPPLPSARRSARQEDDDRPSFSMR